MIVAVELTKPRPTVAFVAVVRYANCGPPEKTGNANVPFEPTLTDPMPSFSPRLATRGAPTGKFALTATTAA